MVDEFLEENKDYLKSSNKDETDSEMPSDSSDNDDDDGEGASEVESSCSSIQSSSYVSS